MATLGSGRYTCDREATIAAYARAQAGGADTCSCNGCRNFVLAREEAFPPGFVTLLDELGIDPTKDGEIYHTAQLAPGKHLYGGWFHFVGTLDVTGDFPLVDISESFSISLCRNYAPCLESLKGLSLVQLELTATAVPWRLDEEEAV